MFSKLQEKSLVNRKHLKHGSVVKREFTGQLNFKCQEDVTAALLEIRERHHIEPVDFSRGLLKAACQFYRENGWFSFPVVIEPLAFQAKFVAETAAIMEKKAKEKK